ncbi:MAG: hypothetical protein HOP31_02705 [Ignavibacteria bacterium]|nr:hypothetical protein [Ignavibacteria bacterium]
MKRSIKQKISIIPLLFAMIFALTMQTNSQNVSVNENEISTSNENGTNVIILEDNSTENTSTENKKTEEQTKKETTPEVEKFQPEELEGGNWVLTGVETKSYNLMNITKWNTNETGIKATCSWKDKIEIIHTVESGFKWQDPPKNMQPGAYLNLEAVYTNIDYSTTANINTGIKMFFGRAGSDYKNPEANSIEVLKLNKDNKQYANEVKKGFYYAPNMAFDATNMCQFIVDCYVGKDHYVTTYTYAYQK